MAPITRYTRFVALSKRFLWLFIGLMIALVVWIASDNSGENKARMVFSAMQKTGALQDIMLKPHYQGLDAHGRPYSVAAEQASQIDQDTVAMTTIHADMNLDNGAWLALNAGKGTLKISAKKLELHGGVDVFYDAGFEFRTDHAQVDIQNGSAYGDAPVEGQGPPGTLKADTFEVTGRGQTIRFNGSVRMKLYH